MNVNTFMDKVYSSLIEVIRFKLANPQVGHNYLAVSNELFTAFFWQFIKLSHNSIQILTAHEGNCAK